MGSVGWSRTPPYTPGPALHPRAPDTEAFAPGKEGPPPAPQTSWLGGGLSVGTGSSRSC